MNDESLSTSAAGSATPSTPRNPPWTIDELILALDLYLQHHGNPPGKNSAEIVQLSETLNAMASKFGASDYEKFRNPNGVYMKLMNFRRFDPDYTASGRVGLTRGNKNEQVVWERFAANPAKLRSVANAIKVAIELPEVENRADEPEDMEAEEGRVLTRLHHTRERNRKLIDKRKAQALAKQGKLECEVCGFDFERRYGARGKGFIEAHHTKPVHTLTEGSTTKLSDLALVCANCHRMIHAARPWLEINELKALLAL
jgi:5-methylcytosine-specific restriction protein A